MKMHDIIYGPLITEKAAAAKDVNRTLSFKVAPHANKTEIKRAVESLFKVKVSAVRTASVSGKLKRYGRFEGRRPDWKKAFVTLREGEQMIEFFEGV
ncbi:MAG TPA: 50S ribosomal protein L23 [Vicinamibacteria bacterium]|jgi:large subunit ribosomal protein L23